ncbi:hypothetical protein BHE74_00015852, partial [Ensete ventricosum]
MRTQRSIHSKLSKAEGKKERRHKRGREAEYRRSMPGSQREGTATGWRSKARAAPAATANGTKARDQARRRSPEAPDRVGWVGPGGRGARKGRPRWGLEAMREKKVERNPMDDEWEDPKLGFTPY